MAWRLEQDMTAAILPDLHFPDGNQGEHGHDGMKGLMFDGRDERPHRACRHQVNHRETVTASAVQRGHQVSTSNDRPNPMRLRTADGRPIRAAMPMGQRRTLSPMRMASLKAVVRGFDADLYLGCCGPAHTQPFGEGGLEGRAVGDGEGVGPFHDKLIGVGGVGFPIPGLDGNAAPPDRGGLRLRGEQFVSEAGGQLRFLQLAEFSLHTVSSARRRAAPCPWRTGPHNCSSSAVPDSAGLRCRPRQCWCGTRSRPCAGG